MKRFDHSDLLPKLLKVMPVGVWILDAEGNIVSANEEAQRIWGGAHFVPLDELHVYKGWWRKTGSPVAPEDWASVRAIKHGQTSTDEEIEIECFDGSKKVIINAATPVLGDDGAVVGAVVTNVDITGRVSLEEKLRTLAEEDALTKTYSRRKLFSLLEHEMHRSERYNHPLSSVLLDLDNFKKINDTFGHQVGDDVLVEVTKTVRLHVREADVFGRLGGEEFLLVLPETHADEAAQIAEKLRRDISQIEMDSVGGVTCSMGVSQYKAGEGSSGFMKRVDSAMYRAKSAGRNRVMVETAG